MTNFEFEVSGVSFRCIVTPDDTMGMPWEEHDGHGSIRTAYRNYGRPEKSAGEKIIHADGRTYWIYDVRNAVKTARRDGWSSADCTDDMTPGERAARAVDADIRYCQEWLSGYRCWACIEVARLSPDGDTIGPSEYLGGVEVGHTRADDAYLKECAEELAGQILHAQREAWREALRGARERKYWAQRDVMTS